MSNHFGVAEKHLFIAIVTTQLIYVVRILKDNRGLNLAKFDCYGKRSNCTVECNLSGPIFIYSFVNPALYN